MAGTSLLALLDDIATLLDDISVMTKVAAKKTAGVLGDDLALNAQQVSGVSADRELPVVWAVAKGSFVNKLILVPAALAISVFLPFMIAPLLMLGGAYLCFEGFEKVFHKYLPHDKPAGLEDEHSPQERLEAIKKPEVDMVEFERKKIKGAIRTDFILSAEIIVIALGTVADKPFSTKAGVVIAIALLITVFVYGLVAGIVKMDDAGLSLMKNSKPGIANSIARKLGQALVFTAPKLLKTLAVVGTIAMFLVGGGIFVHGLHFLDNWMHIAQNYFTAFGSFGEFFSLLVPTLWNLLVGLIVGGICVFVVFALAPVVKKLKPA